MLLEKPTVSATPPYVQTQFVGRVCSMLSLQLLVTAAACGTMSLVPEVRTHVVGAAPWLVGTSSIATVVSLVGAHCYATSHPHNLVWLAVFTCCESATVGTVVAVHVAADHVYPLAIQETNQN